METVIWLNWGKEGRNRFFVLCVYCNVPMGDPFIWVENNMIPFLQITARVNKFTQGIDDASYFIAWVEGPISYSIMSWAFSLRDVAGHRRHRWNWRYRTGTTQSVTGTGTHHLPIQAILSSNWQYLHQLCPNN